MVKNPSCNAGDKGSIPGLGTRIPHAAAQLNVHTAKKPNSAQKKKKRESQVDIMLLLVLERKISRAYIAIKSLEKFIENSFFRQEL